MALEDVQLILPIIIMDLSHFLVSSLDMVLDLVSSLVTPNSFIGFLLLLLPMTKKELEENPTKTREFVLSKLGIIPDQVRGVFESTELEAFKLISPLRYRKPWELLWKSISKGNVCVAGDALHPMTPDLGQGGCSALEDGVVLARCLGEVLLRNSSKKSEKLEEEYKNIEMGLKKYASERKWRSFDLVATAYVIGFIQQSHNKVLSFLRDKFLASFLATWVFKKADFDCGKLTNN
uniref:FAD-binding domain-containing protein n=1 Tax=Cannabis sativa TaxID=3483 RepID=A0A803QYJ3_CANSA